MKSIHLCVPVLRRYDLLRRMMTSLQRCTAKPDGVYIVDNGGDEERLSMALLECPVEVHVEKPHEPMGVAESWNWFIENVSEERVIANDDVSFAPDSFTKLVAPQADLVWAEGFGFSCFVIRDACVEKLGLFDEDISPGYGYYEDEDYLQRLDGKGTRPALATAVNVDCGIVHEHSATLKAASHEQLLAHHKLFKVAQGNYMKKWGLTTI